MTLTYYKDYQKLFAGCVAYYDGSTSGTTLNNIINTAQNGTLGANASIVSDRFDKLRSMKTTPSSITDSTAIITCYPQTGDLYAMCGWFYFVTGSSTTEPVQSICYNNTTQKLFSIGDFTGSFDPLLAIIDNKNGRIIYTTNTVPSGWNHVAIRWNGTRYEFYANGILIPAFEWSATISIITLASDHKIGFWTKAAPIHYYGTTVSDYMVFTSSISPEQIKTIYNLTRTKYIYPVMPGVRGVE